MTGRAGLLDTCGDVGGFRTGVLDGIGFASLAGLGCVITAVVGGVDTSRPGLPLGAGMLIPRPIPGRRLGAVTEGITLGVDVWRSFCGIRHLGAAVTRGMVTVLAGGTVTLTAIGALVVGCLMGTDTMSEDGLAATGALAVGCFV